MHLSDLQYLMNQLGPVTPEITTIVQESIDCWMVELDEGISLQIAWIERSARVLMKCAIGQPDEAAREAIYASLLNANLQLAGIADVKLALSETDDVMLIGEYDLGEASIDELGSKLTTFLGYAGKFSLWLAGTLTAESEAMISRMVVMHHIPA